MWYHNFSLNVVMTYIHTFVYGFGILCLCQEAKVHVHMKESLTVLLNGSNVLISCPRGIRIPHLHYY